jgi:hypothetical protein
MTVYAIALLNILDRERYGTYQQGVMEIFCIAASCWLWMRRRRSRRATGPTPAQFWLNSQAPMHSSPGLTQTAKPPPMAGRKQEVLQLRE